MHAGRQKFFAQSGERGRARSAEEIRRARQIELIDQAALEERAKKCWAAFAGNSAHLVFPAQCSKHPDKIDMFCFAQMQRRFLPKGRLNFSRHSRCRKNDDWSRSRGIRLKNL